MSLDEGAEVVGAFPISDNDGLVLVTNGGQLIRCLFRGCTFIARAHGTVL